MSTEPTIYSGINIARHDTAKEWAKAVNFVPRDCELIVYKPDAEGDTYNTVVTINDVSYPVQSSDKFRLKFGDGISNVNALPFVETGGGSGLSYEEMVAYIEDVEHLNTVVFSERTAVIGSSIYLDDIHQIQSDIKIRVGSNNLLDLSTIVPHCSGDDWTIDRSLVYPVVFRPNSSNASDLSIDHTIKLPVDGTYSLLNTGSFPFSIKLKDADGIVRNEQTLNVDTDIIIDTTYNKCQYVNIVANNVKASEGNAEICLFIEPTSSFYQEEYEPIKSGVPVNFIGLNMFPSNETFTATSDTIDVFIYAEKVSSLTRDKNAVTFTLDDIIQREITLTDSNGIIIMSTDTPIYLLPGTYTLLYSWSNNTLSQLMLVRGTGEGVQYVPYACTTLISDAEGCVSAEAVQYPVCHIGLDIISNGDNLKNLLYVEYDKHLHTTPYNSKTIPTSADECQQKFAEVSVDTNDECNLVLNHSTTQVGNAGSGNYLKFGDTYVTAFGHFNIDSTPTAKRHAVNKAYIDDKIQYGTSEPPADAPVGTLYLQYVD